jgi:hypothetical protein
MAAARRTFIPKLPFDSFLSLRLKRRQLGRCANSQAIFWSVAALICRTIKTSRRLRRVDQKTSDPAAYHAKIEQIPSLR